MPLTYAKHQDYWWPIDVPKPRDGEIVTESFRVKFRKIGEKEFKERTQRKDSDRTILMEHVLDWDEVLDEEGNPVPFSTEALDHLLDDLGVLRVMIDLLFETSFSKWPEVEVGNSKASPGT